MQSTDKLPRWGNVRITLGDRSIRHGKVLVDHGDKVLVEYQTAGGYFQCRKLDRSTIELLPTELCGASGTRDRVCAAGLGHVGDHNFVVRTARED